MARRGQARKSLISRGQLVCHFIRGECRVARAVETPPGQQPEWVTLGEQR